MYDYSSLLAKTKLIDSWEVLYERDLSLAQNLLNFLKRSVVLPHDFYDLIVAYLLIPSALSQVVPYVFLFGQSGTGKSTLGKLASYWYGVNINSSNDTFASIRNSLNEQKYQEIFIPTDDEHLPPVVKHTEVNTAMIWDDIDPSVFSNNSNIYRLFKFGYDRATDKITISSENRGENLEFHCFCPKIFSSISPFH